MATVECDLRALALCEQRGLAWPPATQDLTRSSSTLMAAAPRHGFIWPGKCKVGCAKGEWYAPCAEAHGAASCPREKSPLVVFTHMPKAPHPHAHRPTHPQSYEPAHTP